MGISAAADGRGSAWEKCYVYENHLPGKRPTHSFWNKHGGSYLWSSWCSRRHATLERIAFKETTIAEVVLLAPDSLLSMSQIFPAVNLCKLHGCCPSLFVIFCCPISVPLPVTNLIGSNDRSSANVCQRSQSLFISSSGHNLIERSQLDSVTKKCVSRSRLCFSLAFYIELETSI